MFLVSYNNTIVLTKVNHSNVENEYFNTTLSFCGHPSWLKVGCDESLANSLMQDKIPNPKLLLDTFSFLYALFFNIYPSKRKLIFS